MSSTDSPFPRRSHARRVLHVLGSPYFRYRHARLLQRDPRGTRHDRVDRASRPASTFRTAFGLRSPVLVVVGGLQHFGNIRKKSAERALGTMLGAGFGPALILLQGVTGSLTLTFILDVGDCRRLRLPRDRQAGLRRAPHGDHDDDRVGPRRPADRRRPVAHGEAC